MALFDHSNLLRHAAPLRVMKYTANSELIGRARELLWVIARCDVEDVTGHRGLALAQLCDLESCAGALHISDLYEEIVTHEA